MKKVLICLLLIFVGCTNLKQDKRDNKNEKYYTSGKLFSKENIIDNKYQGQQFVYYENGNKLSEINYEDGKESSAKIYYEDGKILMNMENKLKTTLYYKNGKQIFVMDNVNVALFNEDGSEAFSVSPDGIKLKGEPAKKSLLDVFNNKEKILMTALTYILTNDIVAAEYKNGQKSVELKGLLVKTYYENGKTMLQISGNLDRSVLIKMYYENGNLMLEESRTKSQGNSRKMYDKSGKLMEDIKISKDGYVEKK